jgi:integrase
MKLMALTYVRTNELIGARWEEFDLKEKRWTIPAERMKRVGGKPTPHIVPLAKQTIALLKTLHSITGGHPILFPGDRDCANTISNNTILYALYRMGYEGRMTGHGFRGIASTILHESGKFDSEHIDLQLAHMKRNKVSAAYNHAKYLKQRTEMMQWWADYIEKAQREAIPSVGPFAIAG